jgi:hypothetical protein
MKAYSTKVLQIGLMVVVASLVGTRSAEAGTVACNTKNVDVTSYVTNTSGCQWSTSFNNDPASPPIEVNADAFFGFNDWQLAEQGVNKNAASGSWDVTSYTNFANYDWLIIFKNGSFYNLVGYYAPTSFSGTWNTPFVAHLNGPGTPKSTNQDVSHVSYYFRASTTEITETPEPASLLLLGAGLTALAVRLRRRRA